MQLTCMRPYDGIWECFEIKDTGAFVDVRKVTFGHCAVFTERSLACGTQKMGMFWKFPRVFALIRGGCSWIEIKEQEEDRGGWGLPGGQSKESRQLTGAPDT